MTVGGCAGVPALHRSCQAPVGAPERLQGFPAGHSLHARRDTDLCSLGDQLGGLAVFHITQLLPRPASLYK